MPRLSESAHITVKGFSSTYQSPVEDQVQDVYSALRRYAQVHGFKPYTHHGPYGAKKGTAGPLVLKRIVKQLYPEYSDPEFDLRYGLISQVLKKTDAAVCVKQPQRDGNGHTNSSPEWFVNDTMPQNLVVVALNLQSKSAGLRVPQPFDENAYLTKRERFRVSPEEAGETQAPAPVTVTQKETETRANRAASLRERHEENARLHNILVERVMDEMRTTPIPLGIDEVRDIVNRDPEFNYHSSTYRDIMNQLEKDGVLVKRLETPEEKVVRGGGHPPKGKRLLLWWPSPGPVPPRDRLPEGIAPYRSARDWADDIAAQQKADRDAVLSYIRDTPDNERRRRLNMLQNLNITEDRLEAALNHLIGAGLVRHDDRHRYYTSKKRRTAGVSATEVVVPPVPELPEDTPANEPEPVYTSPPTPDIVQLTPTAVPDPDSLQLVLDLAAKLGVTLPTGPDPEVETLRTEIDRLRKQVSALKTAIATME